MTPGPVRCGSTGTGRTGWRHGCGPSGPGRPARSGPCASCRPSVLRDVPPDLFEVMSRRLPGPFLPGEDAHGRDAVELHVGQRPEEDVPVHFPLADVEVLVHARGRAGRVHDVAQAGRGPVVEGVRDMHLRQQRPGVLHDPFDVAALMEGVRRAVQERYEVLIYPPNEIDPGSAVLDEVIRVR